MRKRRYTVLDNVISVAIGAIFACLLIPHIITAHASPYSIFKRNVETIQVSFEEEIEQVNNEKETIEPIELYFKYTQEDICLVGNTTFHEVGVLFKYCSHDEAIKAAKMTASCVVNRAKMNYEFFGETIEQQIFAKRQYGCSSKVTNQRQSDVPQIFYDLAEEILRDGPVVSARLVYQAQFEQGQVVDNIYNQYFGLVSEELYEYYTKSN